LAPFIAKVTLASYECKNVNFEISGNNAFLCLLTNKEEIVTFWMIFQKVQLSAFLWGVGTAIGELPPYFVARAGINI
jgi:vacuole membrane protein 1